MNTTKLYWHELLRVWAQWLGLGIAAIPTGIFLGLLLRSGVGENAALAISLSFGFGLALSLWVFIDRKLAMKPKVATAVAGSGVVLELREPDGRAYPAFAMATLMMISIYTCVPSSSASPQLTLASHGIPQL